MDNLFEKIYSIDTLRAAWKHVLRKNSTGGIDDIQPDDLLPDIEKKLAELSSSLKNNTYVPVPYAKSAIPKFNEKNEWRKLSLPSVIDKIVQQAFVMVVEPVFEPQFKDCSYAYRKGKGAVRAIKHLDFYLDTANVKWAVTMDIDDFFDTMNHKCLINTFKKTINDEKLLNLISLWLNAGTISKKGDWDDPDEGISQGSVVSPLLSNVYLHALDEFAVKKELKYIRYSDNFVMVSKNRDKIYMAFEQINEFLENRLFLKLNENPYPFKDIQKGFVFLGIYFKGRLRRISSSKEVKIFRQLNYYTDKKYHNNVEWFKKTLNSSIKGKKRYYSFINPVLQFEAFDQHLIKRLKFLLEHFIRKKILADKEELTELLMNITFFINKKPADKKALCKSLANDIFKTANNVRDRQNKTRQTSHAASSAQSKKSSAQKNKYLKKIADQTEIQISTPGVFVGKTSARIIVRQNRKNILELPFSKIKNISINTNGVSLSSDLVFQCSRNTIPITFYNYTGLPCAVLESPMYSMGDLSVRQIKAYETEKALELTKKILKGKSTNQINLLKYYLRSRKSKANEFSINVETSLEKMKEILENLQKIEMAKPYSVTRDRLFSAEARISAYYWGCMKLLLQPELGFTKRVRFKACDLVNNMLNYGYGILYQRVWQSIMKSGLNPYISFLHAFQAGKPTLVYDMVEEFRQPFIDRAIFSFMTKGKKGTDLKIDDKTGLLNKYTKDQVVKSVLGRFSNLIFFRGRKVKGETIVELQIKNLVLFLKDNKTYKPFIAGY